MSQQTEAPPTPQRVDHFTVAERKARGKAERAEVPRNVHAGWEPAGDAAGPGRPARGAGQDARARAGADPVRADARLAVHVLPRRRLHHGGRPGGHGRGPGCTPNSAATRTCPTSARTRLPTGGSCSTSTTSTRRCRARSSGTSSAWSRASRSPVATVGSTTSSAGRSTWRPRARIARRSESTRRWATWTSGTRASTWTRSSRPCSHL